MFSSWSLSAAPGRTLISSIIGVIVLGTALLSLPMAQAMPMTIVDTLFTATSATCVTGLLTVPLDSFTYFGKMIILALIQIGGLGLITMTVFLVSLFFRVGIKPHLLAGQLFELDNWQNSKNVITFIIALTMFSEITGALLLFFCLPQNVLSDHPWFTTFFHSISSFCSAGFTLFPVESTPLAYNLPFLAITITLILIGELGFITWYELWDYAKAWLARKHFKLSLHSRIVLSYSSLLILITTALFFYLEYDHALQADSLFYKCVYSFFNAVSFRSCGFSTIPMGALHLATLFLIMIITFIGASPGSTGSGIKITSVALIFASIRSVVTGRSAIELRGRRIPNDQVFKVMAVFALAMIWISLTTFVLLITEAHNQPTLLSILFESITAFANLGITLDTTSKLSLVGKIIVMINMILGRIGALTLILAFKKHKELTEFQYPEERVMLS